MEDTLNISSKKCTKCLVFKDFSCFGPRTVYPGKFRSWCLLCEKLKTKAHRENNKEKADAATNRWRRNNPDKVREYGRSNYARHREEAIANVEKYQEEHKLEVREWKRKYEHSDKGKLAKRVKQGKRRAILIEGSLPEVIPPSLVAKLMQVFNNTCVWCNKEMGELPEAIDHIFPLKPRKGEQAGQHILSNLAPACSKCNSSKGNRPPQNWAVICGVSLDFILSRANLLNVETAGGY